MKIKTITLRRRKRQPIEAEYTELENTEKFTSVKKDACEKLILTADEMIEKNGFEEDE